MIETQFTDEITDSLCVGQRRPQDTDESVVLFLLMRPGHSLTAELIGRVKEAIKKALSARHVPKYIFMTPEIPVCTFFFDFHFGVGCDGGKILITGSTDDGEPQKG